MKLRKVKIFAIGLVIAAIAITQYGCEKDWQKEFASATLKGPATATVSINTVKDSTAMLDYSISAVGRIFVVVIPGNSETADPDPALMLKLTTPGKVFTKQIIFKDPAMLTGSVKITGLVQNVSYRVFALPLNEDNVLGTIVSTDAFTTSDHYAPTLSLTSGVSPAISTATPQIVAFKPVLSFNEPVALAATIDIKMGYRNAVTGAIALVNVPAANISIVSNKVTITQPQVALNGQYLFLSIASGSIVDKAGNPYAGVTSTLTGSTFSGIFWRVAFATTATQQILPIEDVTTNTAFKITLDYPIKMRLPSGSVEAAYDPSKVIVRYISSGTTIDVQVPAANIAIVQDTLVQITLPRTPTFGENVTLSVGEGSFRNSYGNPSAAIAFGAKSWFLSYGYARTLILGTYVVHCVSIYDPFPAYDFNVTIEAKAGSSTGVVITGIENTTVPINGEFNGDLATLTIATGQSLGDLMGDGSVVKIGGYASSSVNAVGTIASNGAITMSFAERIVGGTYDGYVYDKYNSTWTKSVVKASSSVKSFRIPFKE